LDSYSWLNARSRADDVVLADFENSNHMPQYTHNVVFCGYDNAVEFGDKLRDLQQFFDPKTATEFRKRLIQQNAIQFVLLTAAEQQDIAAIGEVPFLREVFRNNAAVIFSVTDVRSERRIPGTRKTDSML
jgi:UDP-galactopyranose mutase